MRHFLLSNDSFRMSVSVKSLLEMHYKDFDIRKEGNMFHVKRIIYPRMSLIIDCTLPMPQLKDVTILDECSGTEIKEILSSLEDFIRKLNV